MDDVASFLMKYVDVMFAIYALLFAAIAGVWFRTERWSLEVALFVLSTIVMPLLYLRMIFWDPRGAIILAPQFFWLLLLACFTVWPLLKKNGLAPILIALSFLINAAGYAWTTTILHSTGKF